MKRVATFSAKAAAVLGACALVTFAVACDEDGKTAPERCSTLPAPFDIQAAGAPTDDNRSLNPGSGGENGLPKCVTEVGHAVSSFADGVAGDGSVAGTSSGGSSTGGSGGSGTGGSGGSSLGGDTGTAGSADAGAGGA